MVAISRAHPLVLDVTDLAAIPAAVSRAENLAGPIDVLVNNAGYGHEGALEESSADDLQRQFAANVYGPVAMMQAVLPGRPRAAVSRAIQPGRRKRCSIRSLLPTRRHASFSAPMRSSSSRKSWMQ